jgi:hypothetical protein
MLMPSYYWDVPLPCSDGCAQLRPFECPVDPRSIMLIVDSEGQ